MKDADDEEEVADVLAEEEESDPGTFVEQIRSVPASDKSQRKKNLDKLTPNQSNLVIFTK